MIKYIYEFGLKIYIIAGFTKVLRKLKMNKILTKYEKFKYHIIIKWLNIRYGQEAREIAKRSTENSKIQPDAPVWIFWWQGEQAMPPIVRSCYKSVLRNAKEHNVILITKDNIKRYVNISPYIYEKIIEKKITLTHFSDILREKLLSQHGGIWMDATIYMTGPFEKEMYTYEYYTIKGAFKGWEWTDFFQASGKGNILANVVSCLFDRYWKEHDCLISYLLIDCFLEVARKNSWKIDKMIECLPQKNSSIFFA